MGMVMAMARGKRMLRLAIVVTMAVAMEAMEATQAMAMVMDMVMDMARGRLMLRLSPDTVDTAMAATDTATATVMAMDTDMARGRQSRVASPAVRVIKATVVAMAMAVAMATMVSAFSPESSTEDLVTHEVDKIYCLVIRSFFHVSSHHEEDRRGIDLPLLLLLLLLLLLPATKVPEIVHLVFNMEFLAKFLVQKLDQETWLNRTHLKDN